MNFERPKSQTSRGQLYGSFCIIHAMINREKEGSKPATPKHIELCSSVTACKKLQTITKQEVKTKAPLSKKKTQSGHQYSFKLATPNGKDILSQSTKATVNCMFNRSTDKFLPCTQTL